MLYLHYITFTFFKVYFLQNSTKKHKKARDNIIQIHNDYFEGKQIRKRLKLKSWDSEKEPRKKVKEIKCTKEEVTEYFNNELQIRLNNI